jgi:hypothetical protein
MVSTIFQENNLNFQLFLKAENTTQNSYINRKFLYKQNHDRVTFEF